jgi:hypothetical protein
MSVRANTYSDDTRIAAASHGARPGGTSSARQMNSAGTNT